MGLLDFFEGLSISVSQKPKPMPWGAQTLAEYFGAPEQLPMPSIVVCPFGEGWECTLHCKHTRKWRPRLQIIVFQDSPTPIETRVRQWLQQRAPCSCPERAPLLPLTPPRQRQVIAEQPPAGGLVGRPDLDACDALLRAWGWHR